MKHIERDKDNSSDEKTQEKKDLYNRVSKIG